ncbi:HAD hydrolase family protein, partial [Escherichia coli]|uniref:HAD hydrolase family protein n=1 Tax=Escherichia coli TaxID=562 RepID=UPI002022F469
MISMTKADLRLAVQRLISSSIVMLMSVISTHYDLSRISVGHYIPQVQKALHEAIGDIMVSVHTGNGSIDLIIPGVHKANGLRQLQKLWGIDDSEVVVFGDGGNDIEMLRQAGFSFAMENAGSAVVAAAKYRAGSNNREGVLDVIDKVLKHEAPFDQ